MKCFTLRPSSLAVSSSEGFSKKAFAIPAVVLVAMAMARAGEVEPIQTVTTFVR